MLLVVASAGLFPLTPARAAPPKPVFPAGSRIGLVLPPGALKPSVQFPGFIDSAHKVSIALFDLPGRAYDTLEQSAFRNRVKGLTIDKRELFSFAGGIGYLVIGEAEIRGSKVHAWYLLANTITRKAGRVAAFIRVHVPEKARAAYPDAAIRAALRSVTFRPPPLAALLKRLPFEIKDMAGFRVMRVTRTGLAVLIDGPKNDPFHHPYMVVAMGRGAPREPKARARFARELLTSAPVGNLHVTSMEAMRLSSHPGIEVRADGKGPDGKPLALVQWLRFQGSAFLRVIGVVPKPDWDKLFPRFRAVRDGIDLR
ncbi:MAG: hypothetical protein P8Y53_00870 [Pseudolabrys sp.]